jgi:hypothetical protein
VRAGRLGLDPPRLRRLAFRIGAALVAVLAGLHVLYYFPRVVDDAYIFFRYAENLALGRGPVYNLGERVEGFSSPLWVFLLAAGRLLGGDIVVWCKLLSLVSLAALFLGVWRFARERLGTSRPAALLACAFIALNSYVMSWALWGLETPAYLALMVWTAVLLGRVAEGTASRNARSLAVVASAFTLSRPEAPLLLSVLGLGAALEPLRLRPIAARVRRLIGPLAIAAAVFAAWLLFRRVYFGRWLPNTYYAKQGSGWDWGNLRPLWGQGSGLLELALLWGGAALSVLLAAVRRSTAPLLVAVATVGFTASVYLDWMPNVRHLLPLYIFLPLAWAWGADRAGRLRWPKVAGARGRLAGGLAAATAAVLVLGTGAMLARTDARYSALDFTTHGESERWLLPKTAEKWGDTWLCLTRRVPRHVREMHPFEMGMIAQLYRLVESDARPLEDTWYIGRDIGRVGWLAPANVFDTDGLFTPAVVADASWRRDRSVSRLLSREALGRPVVMTELIGDWDLAARTDPDIRQAYETLYPDDWGLLAPRERELPSPAEVVARYDWAARRLPSWFYVMTIYGEAVGAAVERRRDIVRKGAADNAKSIVGAVPEGLVGGPVTLEGVGVLLGCRVEPETVRPGDELLVVCYFRATGGTQGRYDVFLHLEERETPFRFVGDHGPAGGFLPTDRWETGAIVRDAARVQVPRDAPSGVGQVFVGLFDGDRRVRAAPPERLDATGRALGPTFRVVAR